MRQFTGMEYLHIALANHFGLDKLDWDERLKWTNDNYHQVDQLIKDAKEPLLFEKTIRAIDDAMYGRPSGYLLGIDATASGLQIMGAMSGCKSTCEVTNLTSAHRNDVYTNVAKEMSKNLNDPIERDEIKHPVMTTFYGSKNQPKEILGEDTPELAMFYEILHRDLPGPMQLMDIMQAAWDPDALEYSWVLPDGHTAMFKVMVPVDKRIKIAELDEASFTHRAYVNEPVERGLSLAANIIHSIDGFIVREMARRAHDQGYPLLTIHDSFWCHPNYGNQTRENYLDIFKDEINMDLFNDIMSQLSSKKRNFKPFTNNLNSKFTGEYALS